jgi:hypothetical protein
VLAKVRARLTYANVVATVALFVALGGSSYAAISITGKNVKNSSLTGKDVKNNSLTGSDVKNIKSGDVSDHSLLAKDFSAGQLPAGPQGQKGDTGVPGTARAYAHILADGSIDSAHSKGVGHALNAENGLHCGEFTFGTPNVVVVSQDLATGTGFAVAHPEANSCVVGGVNYNAQVSTTSSVGGQADRAFYVFAN